MTETRGERTDESSAQTTTTKPLAHERIDDWTSFVADHRLATPFHTLAWKRAVERTMGYEPRYRLWYQDGKPVAAVPAFETPEIVGSSLVSPFCCHGFPLVAAGVDTRPIIEHLATSSRGTFETRVVKERSDTGITAYNAVGYGAVTTGVTFRLPVSAPYDVVWDELFQSSLKKNVRTAEDSGLTVTESDDIDRYYDLYLETMRRLGSPQFPKVFFEELASQFGDDFRLFIARLDGSAVAGLLAFDHADERSLWSAASDPDYLSKRPNELVYAETIRDACEHDHTVVDFGRTDSDSGVYEFKTQFGATEHRLASMVAPPRRTSQASISGYKQLAPITQTLSPVITHPAVGPHLKRWLHE